MALQVVRNDDTEDGATITVPAADGTKTTIQTLYNAIRDFEMLSANMDMRVMCDPSTDGKAALGEGNETGVTLKLLNKTLLEFEARAGPAVIACKVSGGNLTADLTWDGTATSADTGTQLTDTAATFATWGIQEGDTIRNVDDGSTATVTSVDSETQITHSALSGGTENDWDIGEIYEIDSVHPLSPTAYTHVTIAQDTSPVNVEQTVDSMKALIQGLYAVAMGRQVM